MDPASRRAGRGAEHVDEGGHVVVGDPLALLDGGHGEGRRADGLQLPLRRPVELRRGRDLHVAPGGHLRLVGPHGADLGSGVAVDHAEGNESGHVDFRSGGT